MHGRDGSGRSADRPEPSDDPPAPHPRRQNPFHHLAPEKVMEAWPDWTNVDWSGPALLAAVSLILVTLAVALCHSLGLTRTEPDCWLRTEVPGRDDEEH